MSETSPSQLTQIVNRIGRKPFAAAGGTALWRAVDDVGRRQEEIRSRLATRLDRLAAQAKADRQRAHGIRQRVSTLESRAQATEADTAEQLRILTETVEDLTLRLRRVEQARPRVVPGQPPKPNPDALERREAALAAPIASLSNALDEHSNS